MFPALPTPYRSQCEALMVSRCPSEPYGSTALRSPAPERSPMGMQSP